MGERRGVLDDCLFRSNTRAAIIDATLTDAKRKLAKIKFAYDPLPVTIRMLVRTTTANTEVRSFPMVRKSRSALRSAATPRRSSMSPSTEKYLRKVLKQLVILEQAPSMPSQNREKSLLRALRTELEANFTIWYSERLL